MVISLPILTLHHQPADFGGAGRLPRGTLPTARSGRGVVAVVEPTLELRFDPIGRIDDFSLVSLADEVENDPGIVTGEPHGAADEAERGMCASTGDRADPVHAFRAKLFSERVALSRGRRVFDPGFRTTLRANGLGVPMGVLWGFKCNEPGTWFRLVGMTFRLVGTWFRLVATKGNVVPVGGGEHVQADQVGLPAAVGPMTLLA
ncbi:hypothetical protein [Methylobacterium organophilum]|uniref:hypothetical protein n=1 Tax=Methylobacterium organophilum TaxID=410 RepID=UPI001EE3613A|nr:hypothetical protein [Methylobacterium organophilum]